jgi:hypothetical protein
MTTPKHRNIVHLHASMKSGAGAHPMARKPGPSVEEWDDEDMPGLSGSDIQRALDYDNLEAQGFEVDSGL